MSKTNSVFTHKNPDSLRYGLALLSYTKRAMLRAIEAANPLYRSIPIYLSRYGLRIWEQEPHSR